MNEILAECAGATRRFGRFTAVDRVDLQVRRGEIVGLLGANGAGKTTVIRLLLGLLRTSAGDVRLFGESPSRKTRKRLGYVSQGLGLYDDLTPAENMAFSAGVFNHKGREPDLPHALLAFSDAVVGSLPLGIQRIDAFAQALAHQPDLLVLDEPTSGVDPLARARLWDTVADAAAGGVGVLVTTHYMDEAAECDRLLIMANGKVVAAGSPAEITADRTVTVVDSDSWADAFEALEAAGLPAALAGRTLRLPGIAADAVRGALGGLNARVHHEAATLEEAFFQIVLSTQSRGAA